MALINCPDCGTEVSSKAETCKNCGFPLKEAPINIQEKEEEIRKFEKVETNNTLGWIIIVITGLFLWLFPIPEDSWMEWPMRLVVLAIGLYGLYRGYKLVS